MREQANKNIVTGRAGTSHTGKPGCSAGAIVLLELLLAAACLFIFRRFILRDDYLIYNGSGSDTRQQYIMWFSAVVNHLRSGPFPMWDFTNGFGGSMFNYYLFQPLMLIIYGFGVLLGTSAVPGMMVWLIIGEILLSGLFCYLMLSEWRFSDAAKIIAAFMYAFNGFFVIWGQHYGMGFACVELPLLIMAVERSVKNRRNCFGLALVCMLILLSGYYQGYMMMLGTAVYVTLRVLLTEQGKMTEKLKTYFAIGFAMGFGVLMGAVNLLPSVGSLAITSRLDQSGSFFSRLLQNLSLYTGSYYRTLLFRMFGNNLQGVGRYFTGDGNYYEAVTISMGSLAILLLFQFLPLFYSVRRRIAETAAVTAGLAFCAFMLLVRAGSWMFNGFMYAFSRHTFLLTPMIALMAAYALDRILGERKIFLSMVLAAEAVCIFVYRLAWQEYNQPFYRRNALVLLLISILEAVLLASVRLKKIRIRVLAAALGACVVLTTLSDVFLCYNNRESVSKKDPVYAGTFDGDTIQALEWIRGRDDQFYRVEKDYSEAAYYLDSAAQQYSSATTYNSQQNRYIQQFVRSLAPQLLTGFDNSHYDFRSMFQDEPTASLMGIKYLLTHEDDLRVKGYERIGQAGSVYIYRNTGTENIAGFYTKTITGKTWKKIRDEIPFWNLAPDVLITEGKTEFSVKKETLADRKASEATGIIAPAYARLGEEQLCGNVSPDPSVPSESMTDAAGRIVIPLDAQEVSAHESVYVELTVSSDSFMQYHIYMNDGRPVSWYGKGDHTLNILLPEGTEKLTVETEEKEPVFLIKKAKFHISDYLCEPDREAQITVNALTKDDVVSGSASVAEDGILMLAMPYQEGWSARVDGTEAELMRVDYGFTGIPLRAGSHSFELTYEPPLFREGVIVSLVCIVIWLAAFLVTGRAEKRKKQSGERVKK